MSVSGRPRWAIGALVAVGATLIVSYAPAFGLNNVPQPPPTRTTVPDVNKLGPQAGDTVPDFGLPDQHGQTRTLSSLMGPKGLVLVFNRSADW